MTLDAIIEWLDPDKHPFHILILGAIAGQLVLALPDSKFKAYATNVLHGLFPSPQVFANGVPAVPKGPDTVYVEVGSGSTGPLPVAHPPTSVLVPASVVSAVLTSGVAAASPEPKPIPPPLPAPVPVAAGAALDGSVPS